MPDPLILWFRRDLRLGDNPMLAEACRSGRPVVPVFILDPETEALGSAAKWRLGLGVERFAAALEALGSRLVLRRGPALAVLERLIAETGASGVRWTRLYDPASKARDGGVKAALRARGLSAESHAGHLLFEPGSVTAAGGGLYKVFTPFWRAVRDRDAGMPEAAPLALPGPEVWPASDRLADWRLATAMNRGAAVVGPHQTVGEAAAEARLLRFMARPLAGYAAARDFPGRDGTSGLSENLTLGEIGPRRVWLAAWRAMQEGRAAAEPFLRQLAWREFAWHLMHDAPGLASDNWRAGWDDFPWRGDNADAERWQRGMTGEPMVDAAMREMYVTGRMHNRARMIAASYLTKHLLTDWRVGLRWFADCLTDWDAAANALGWQWVAGPGPDAAPYFRVFNPALQAERFDPDGSYRRHYVQGPDGRPGEGARAFFAASPRRWGLHPDAPYPAPVVGLAEGRERALAAFGTRNA